MPMRYAIIHNGLVENVIDYDDPPSNPPPGFPSGYIALQSDTAGPGWLYQDGEFVNPNPPPPPVPYVPQSAPMWAVRTVLQSDGLFDQAQALVTASTDNGLKNVWEYGNFASRTSPSIVALGSALGLTDAQMDQMFIAANALEV
jgi:hypothetical protein